MALTTPPELMADEKTLREGGDHADRLRKSLNILSAILEQPSLREMPWYHQRCLSIILFRLKRLLCCKKKGGSCNYKQSFSHETD